MWEQLFIKYVVFCLPAIVKSPLAGDFITIECRKLMEEAGVEVVPAYQIQSKVHIQLL